MCPIRSLVRDTACRFVLSNLSDARAMGMADSRNAAGQDRFRFLSAELAAQYQAMTWPSCNPASPSSIAKSASVK